MRILLSVAALFLLCLNPPAHGQELFTNLARQYETASAGWMTAGLVYARQLFFGLAAIEIAIFSIYELFRKDGAAEFFTSLLIKCLGLLFAWTLLVEAPIWIPTIIQSFIQAGSTIGHVPVLDPSAVFEQGVSIALNGLNGAQNAPVLDSFLWTILATWVGTFIILAYAIIAAQLIITLIESYLIIGGGVLMLGFAGSRWTTVFTERYFGYLVSIGIKLFVLYLIIGLGTTWAEQLITALAPNMPHAPPAMGRYLDVMGGAIVFMIVSWQVPSIAASMMTGAPSLTLGTAAATTAMLGAALANAVAKGMQQATGAAGATRAAAGGMTELVKASKLGFESYRQGGAGMGTALGRAVLDIGGAAGQQFKDSVIRGTGRAGAVAAEKAAGDQAVQGWGRSTMVGNLTNRMHAKREGVPVETQPGTDAAPAGKTASIHRVTPPAIPHDQAHGNITIRFKSSE